MRSFRWLAAPLLASAVLAPAVAQAQPRPQRVVVVDAEGDADRAAASGLADALVERLRRAGHRARRPEAPPPPTPVAPLVAQAREAYGNLRPAEALELTTEALGLVDGRGARIIERPALLELLLLRAMAALADGQTAVADGSLDAALAIEPALELDPARYAPPLRSRLESRREQGGDTRYALTLDGVPPNAQVRLDGQAVQGTRWELPPGPHRLSVVAPDREPFARVVRLDGDRTVTVDAPEDPERVLAAASAELDALRRAAGRVGASLVRVTVRGGEVVVAEPDTGRSVRLPLDAGADVDALAERARRALTRAPDLEPRPPQDPGEGGPGAWPWLVAGGVAAVVGAVVLSVVLLSGDPNPEGGRWTR